jgi:hypothetical protein
MMFQYVSVFCFKPQVFIDTSKIPRLDALVKTSFSFSAFLLQGGPNGEVNTQLPGPVSPGVATTSHWQHKWAKHHPNPLKPMPLCAKNWL